MTWSVYLLLQVNIYYKNSTYIIYVLVKLLKELNSSISLG